MLTPQQLIFDWAPPLVPAFDNFLAGENAEVVAHLRRFSGGPTDPSQSPSLLLWGAPGSGRTHLLNAAVSEARARGRQATVLDAGAIPQAVAEHNAPAGQVPPAETNGPAQNAVAERNALYALDDVDRLTPEAQGRLFTFYNACREAGSQLLLTAAMPAARMPVRDDLRTRIGAGLILEVRPLSDADKPNALAAYAREHGFSLGPDVIGFLLTRGRRDMGALIAYLRALDRYSLATKRPVTVPLVRELLNAPLFPTEGE